MSKASLAVITLSKELKCGHCGTIFHGSISQAKHLKYEGMLPYCSPVCREASRLKKLQDANIKAGRKPRKGVIVGPCPVCNKMYESKNTDRKYCSQACYTKSDDFKNMLLKNYKKGNEATVKMWDGIMIRECPVCKKEFRARKSEKNKRGATKFCSRLCYRKFKAELFDAWTANPQHIAMPQNYDEFMLQNELPCLVDGCDWSGRHLSSHLVAAHGVKASDFKRAAGFNLTTGLVSPDLHQKLCDRDHMGVAVGRSKEDFLKETGKRSGYVSNESKEHQAKTRALLQGTHGPERTCLNCQKVFRQSTVFGKTIYCSVGCRDEFYRNNKKEVNSNG